MRKSHISQASLGSLADQVLASLKVRRSQVLVHLIAPSEMRRLAQRFFKDPEQHLNVLSFPAPPGPFQVASRKRKKLIGEVYLNRALGRGEAGRAVLIELLIHGVLHLAGYHHTRTRDTIEMETLEARLFQKMFPK